MKKRKKIVSKFFEFGDFIDNYFLENKQSKAEIIEIGGNDCVIVGEKEIYMGNESTYSVFYKFEDEERCYMDTFDWKFNLISNSDKK